MPDNFFNDFSFMKRFIDTYRNGCLLLTFKGTEQDMGKYSVLESETENKEYLKIIQILEKPLPRDTKSRLIGY
jgi:UTP-glucose-1-phosphate uridylyltransferase